MALEIRRVFHIDAFDLTWYQIVAYWNYCIEIKKDNNQAEEVYRNEKRTALKEASVKLKIADGIMDDEVKIEVKVTPEQKQFMKMFGWGQKKAKPQELKVQ